MSKSIHVWKGGPSSHLVCDGATGAIEFYRIAMPDYAEGEAR